MEKYTSIEKNLKIENKKSCAPVTGFLISSAIITKKDIYYGHNTESKNSHVFFHAEQDALNKVLLNEKKPIVTEIVMMGRGIINKFKSYTPCSKCIDVLRPYSNSRTTIKLTPIKRGGRYMRLSFKDISNSYRKLNYSKLNTSTIQKTQIELKSKTFLRKKDMHLMIELVELCKKYHFSLYITGSASGRGGVSNLIMKKTKKKYNDIDLILIVKKRNFNAFEMEMNERIKKIYGKYSKTNRFVPPHKNKKGVVIKNPIYKINDKLKIDLTFASKINGAFRQTPYVLRNWFHQAL